MVRIAQKMKFFIKDLFSKCDEIRKKIVELVTFTEEILNGKLHFVYSDGNTTIIGTKNERNDKKGFQRT